MAFTQEFFKASFPVMHEEKMRAAVERLRSAGVEPPKNIRSNTTVFAISYGTGVVLAGDRRTSDGYLGIAEDTNNKLAALTKYSGMATAGYCNVASFLENNMLVACSRFSGMYKKQLSPDGQAMYLKTLLESWWFFFVATWHWTPSVPILAAYDVKLDKPRIFCFDYDGYFYEPKFFCGTGCGFDFIKGLVIDHWHEGIGEEGTVNLAVRALLHSGAASHGVSDARLVLPTVAIIDKKGFRWVPGRVLKGHRNKLVREIGGLKCLLK